MAGREALANELSGILDGAISSYDRLKEYDRVAQAQDGATAIKTRGFGNKTVENEANSVVYGARERALSAIDREISRVSGDLSTPPSTEAANYIASIAQRNDLSADEVSAALSRYKDHASQKAIKAAASRSGVNFGSYTQEEIYLDELRALRGEVDRTYSAGNFANGSGAFFGVRNAQYQNFASGAGLDSYNVIKNATRSMRP